MTSNLSINLWLALAWLGAFGPVLGFMHAGAIPYAGTGAIVCGLIALTYAVRDVAAALREASAPKVVHLTNNFERSAP